MCEILKALNQLTAKVEELFNKKRKKTNKNKEDGDREQSDTSDQQIR
jgi:hypothetical protein